MDSIAPDAKEWSQAWRTRQNQSRAGDSPTRAQQTRQRIVESARNVFAARGFEGVSLRDIATQAGVTHGLLRHHFGSKEDIWRAVIDTCVADYLAELAPLLADAEQQGCTPAEMLKAGARLLILTAASQPDMTRLLLHEGMAGGPRLAYFMEQIAPIRARMAPRFQAMQRAGGLPQFTDDTFLLALMMLGAVPFAVTAFANGLCRVDLLAPDQVEKHVNCVLATLFPEQKDQDDWRPMFFPSLDARL
ncbi:MAG: TetR/AcrR family transcriptional regulator [Anaerolineales bacterium]|nr:TetR/AcrR family transcriptional regulator [Anaerolineales bacterium]